MTQLKSKTYYNFLEQFNQFEDNQLIPLGRLVCSFCELPTTEKLETISEAFKQAFSSLKFTCKAIKGYIESGYSDITENEMELLKVYLDDLQDSLLFEAQTVQDVIDDETFNTMLELRLHSTEEDITITT